MFEYTLLRECNYEKYKNWVVFLGKLFPSMKIERKIDESKFSDGKNEIIIKNDSDVYAIYVESTIEIPQLKQYQMN